MHGKRILLTEGEKFMADKICKVLVQEHYDVDVALEGNMGRQLFNQHAYDLALIDFHLPDMNGCDLCQYIRNTNSNMPLMMVSSEATVRGFEVFQAGVDDYVLLSEDFRELLMRIRVLTKRYSTPFVRKSRITAGDILVDLDSKEVRRGDRLILLSAREFLLLQFLIRNKNRIVSRDEIVSNIWGRECSAKEGRVAAFINSLRKKIEEDFSHKCIYTVTGKGYLLTEKPD
ncbi:MAG TPA: response regulator transcription factor [Pedobacter sp.]|uniref:response regulator transcription factor n=1 Tax=Pedobacter sp. TaxID=1411316 RepID=UPI002C53C3A5|nr:response regulator transcription factor [Pedobacter sp.]HMI01188.1 response regulator transcription factor [Pedobacter sp.]